ncbi:Cyclin, N-terminal domain containing protein [Trichomonas vaginalis G3]|uniref:Cyclin, N-terminal domain containing protein n=1 Tax=Trichomonas vaginalis (strain ATCC PRA-98 / G3) TaxID=412133 RepID=A2DV14_TRIV3|nr:cell division [Trichomonas vaginalis G3]EAY15741.1 Cyclin, N-terminal domain containing protein [Trichomonas vaginalis G3]KAI5486516.1 cell division [Trichomonas vaginalis G3]|eukprot:XP_001327964.1 Cyclin, N-terminal domain containing protein [Trichomonas vaginalis G3]
MSRPARQPLGVRRNSIAEYSAVKPRRHANQEASVKPSILRSTSQALIDDNDDYSGEFDFRFMTCQIGDPSDALDVCPYQHIIYKTLREKEKSRSTIKFNQNEITFRDRNIMIDKMILIHYKLGLTTNTIYRFIGLFDQVLTSIQVPKNKLMLYACATFLISSKIEDIFPAQSDDLVCLTKNRFSKEELFAAEIEVSNATKYGTIFGTGLFFLTIFQRIEDEEQDFLLYSRYILELCQTSEFFFGKNFSLMAAAAIYTSRIAWHQEPWTPRLEGYTRYSEPVLSECLKEIKNMLSQQSRQESKFIQKKYSSDLFHKVAQIYSLP